MKIAASVCIGLGFLAAIGQAFACSEVSPTTTGGAPTPDGAAAGIGPAASAGGQGVSGSTSGTGGASSGSEPAAGVVGQTAGGHAEAGGVAGAGTVPTSVDALSSDRNSFFGDSRCSTLGALFCDGFEGPSFDSAWKQSGDGSISLDPSQHARGAASAHFRTKGNGFALLRLSKIFPIAGDKYYGRMFVRFDALPTSPTWAHWTIAEAGGSGDGSVIRIGGQLDPKMNRFGVGTDGGPTGDWTNLDQDPLKKPVAPPEDSWI